MAETERWDVVVAGCGPAGLAAAETAAAEGARVLALDRMPSVGRKFLMAGKSGLNLTMDAPQERFLAAFRGPHASAARRACAVFGPSEIRAWAAGLGVETFVGSSGRVFPREMKASPLLRAWLARLAGAGIDIRTRAPIVRLARAPLGGWLVDLAAEAEAPRRLEAGAVVLALGGASWPRLGSDGGWTGLAAELGLDLKPFEASNVGWRVAWSPVFLERFAGAPIKNIALSAGAAQLRGELVVTAQGLEGGPLYALGPEISAAGGAVALDLAPDRSAAALADALAGAPPKASLSEKLRKRAGLDRVKIGLLRESGPPPGGGPLVERIKRCPLRLLGKAPIDRAISSAGGVAAESLDAELMARMAPGVFCAGEMTDWDAPTGGYLLTACIAMGREAGRSAARRARALSL